jgi:hypothetical protein
MPQPLCPSCRELIEPGVDRCTACKHHLVGPDGQRTVATRRDTLEGPQRESFPRASECIGCAATLIEVLDGQVVAYTLVRCDDELCYYEGTPGGLV